MDAAPDSYDEQTRLWNGPAGRAWVDAQAVLDQMLKPLEVPLVEAAAAAAVGSVLDVGCGTGSTTLAVARLVGPQGHCVGIDVSAPMIAAARARAERAGAPVRFIRADAQTHPFEAARYDIILSRLGVMFFADPVAAFANLRRAARRGAGLHFVVWRSAAENPFMTTAERAAAPLLPNLPVRRPDAPGQFAFAEARKVHRILAESGWGEIDMRPIDVACSLPADELVPYLTRLGPVGLALAEADERSRIAVAERLRPAFDPYVQGAEVRFTAACWLVSARAPSAPGTRAGGADV